MYPYYKNPKAEASFGVLNQKKNKKNARHPSPAGTGHAFATKIFSGNQGARC